MRRPIALYTLLAALSIGTAGSATAASDANALKKARAELDAALAERDPELRGQALSALGLAHTPDAREKLEAGTTDLDGKVRFGAARGLALLADPESGPAVALAFKAEKGWAIRKELASAAATTHAQTLIPELEKATHAPQKELATAAAWALIDLGAPSGKPALERLGSPPRKNAHKHGEDRWSRKVLSGANPDGDPVLACRTLAELAGPEDEPLLAQSLTATNWTVRLWAAAGLLRRSSSDVLLPSKK